MIIKGKPVADLMTEELKNKVRILNINGIYPTLSVVRVGSNPDDLSYERGIMNRFRSIGVKVNVIELDCNITEDEYIEVISGLNSDDKVTGILCFRPLPKHINEDVIKHVISPEKDVDAFNPINLSKLMENDKSGYAPCTAKAVMVMLDHYKINLNGADVVVIGRSMVVGKPLALMLTNANATVTLCHSKTKNIMNVCSRADIVIAAIGKAEEIDSAYISNNTVVIDVGINVDEYGNLCGDVDFDDVVDKASLITPVPGGVGSITTTILASQLLQKYNVCGEDNNE